MATITDKKYGVGHKIKLKNISKINKKVHAILVQHGYKDESKFEKISANFEIEIELSINCSLYVILKDENSRIIKLSGDGVLNRIFNHDGKGQRGDRIRCRAGGEGSRCRANHNHSNHLRSRSPRS